MTNHIQREHHPWEFELKVIEKPTIFANDKNINSKISTYENHRHVIIGPSHSGKTFYMLKILKKISKEKSIHLLNQSPNQYPNYKLSIEIKPIDKSKESNAIFDHKLGARNSYPIEEFFTRGKHDSLDFLLYQPELFGLSRQSFRIQSDRKDLFEQTLGNVECMYKEIGGYGMKNIEFKEMSRNALSVRKLFMFF